MKIDESTNVGDVTSYVAAMTTLCSVQAQRESIPYA